MVCQHGDWMATSLPQGFGLNIFCFIYMKGIGQSTDAMLKPSPTLLRGLCGYVLLHMW